MSTPPPPPPSTSSRPGGGGGLSLYADLLDPPGDAAAASISRAPVVSREALDAAKEQDAAAAAAKKPVDAALRFQPFQPIRRPQQKTQQKPKVGFPKVPPGAAASAPAAAAAAAAAATAPPKTTLADWAATDDDDWMYAGAQRPKGNRKKKKKQRDDAPAETNWDEMYDPSRPTNVDEYLRSDERIHEIREWKALLYRHRGPPAKRQASWDSDDDDGDGDRPVNNNQFAPPDSYSFAPPPMSPPRASLPDDKTGDDAYARRLAMSQGVAVPSPAAAAEDPATISRAPVRYEQPEPTSPPPAAAGSPEPMDEDRRSQDGEADADVDAPRSNVPGQKHFATRLMQKFGWSKGQGLGADNSGRAEPLRVQVEKRRKRPDAEGGGWAEPAGKGRIIDTSRKNRPDGTTTATSSSSSKFGAMSPVVVLRHMLDNIENLQHEIEEGLGQEIGEECGAQYGRVERLYIDVPGRNVYIKFVDQVSALRAVNALDGRVFAGSTIAPRYYAEDMFERGVYE